MVTNSKLACYYHIICKTYMALYVCVTSYHYSNVKESEVLIKLKNKKWIS